MSCEVRWCRLAGFLTECLQMLEWDFRETGETGSVRLRYARGCRSVMVVEFSQIIDAEDLGNFGGV